ncbi:MAG: helix-turn-helix domain-containing protein [Elusimicrobiota bacterium]|nr:MAG: helix-turn-helix domain-containing protein [Elusimicrobiota bacterium]
MKTKVRNGVPLSEFLGAELADSEVRAHFEQAKAATLAAQAVVSARRRAGLTQTELGKKIGTDQKGVWRLESGDQNATVETLGKVAKATGGVLVISIKRPPKAIRK